MPQVAGNQVIRPRGIGALQEDVVIGVACNFQPMPWSDKRAAILDQLKQLQTSAPADPQFPPGQHVAIFLDNRF